MEKKKDHHLQCPAKEFNTKTPDSKTRTCRPLHKVCYPTGRCFTVGGILCVFMLTISEFKLTYLEKLW